MITQRYSVGDIVANYGIFIGYSVEEDCLTVLPQPGMGSEYIKIPPILESCRFGGEIIEVIPWDFRKWSQGDWNVMTDSGQPIIEVKDSGRGDNLRVRQSGTSGYYQVNLYTGKPVNPGFARRNIILFRKVI